MKKMGGKIMMIKELKKIIANPEFKLGAVNGKKMETDSY
jgi:hypothetical protein